MKGETEFTIKNLNKEKTLKEIVNIATVKNIKYEGKLFKRVTFRSPKRKALCKFR